MLPSLSLEGAETVTLAGANVTPTSCSPLGTSLSVVVPQQAAYGSTQASVTINGLASQGLPFTVARQPGMFADAGVISNHTSPQTCVTAGGVTNTLQISALTSGNFRAQFSSAAGTIGSLDFAADHVTPIPGIFNLGGATFSRCIAGVVMNGGPPAVDFINLETRQSSTGHTFQTTFANTPGTAGPTAFGPTVYASPDGTLLVLVSPGSFVSVSEHSYRVEVFDRDKARFGQAVAPSDACVNTADTFQVTANNEISYRCAAATKTVPIP